MADPEKKKYKLSVKLSVTFFSEQSVGMTLAQRYTESDTPLIGKQSVAAAHLQATAYAADLPFGNGPVNLGGVRGPQGGKLGFSMFRALGGPPETWEGQNYMF